LIEKISGETAGRKCSFVVLGDRPGAFLGAGVEFVGRHWDMAPFYSICDCVVCRAGASTLAELAAFEIPALTIPWDGAADGHQEANARAFASMTGNLVWAENEGNLEEAFAKLLSRIPASRKEAGDFANDEASFALWRLSEERFPSLI